MRIAILTLSLLALAGSADAQFTRHRALEHATDCTSLSGYKSGQFCFEQDSNQWYVCEPSAGDCDTAGEWTAISAAAAPCGSDTQIQYNSSGACGAESALAWDATNNELELTGTPALGVGTASPSEEIHVQGGSAQNIRIESTGANTDAALELMNDARRYAVEIDGSDDAFRVRDVTFGTDPLRIEATAPNNSFYIDTDGLVGLGTASPAEEIHVSGGSAQVIRVESTGANTVASIELKNDAVTASIAADGTAADALVISGVTEVTLPTGTIGSTEILDGDILEADLKAVDAASDEECLTFEATGGDFEWQSCGGSLDIISEGDSNVEVIDAGTGQVDIDVDGSNVVTVKSGGVGVGTTAPDALVDVSGSTNIDLEVECTGTNCLAEVRIENDGLSWDIENSGALSDTLAFRDGGTGFLPFYIEASSAADSLVVGTGGVGVLNSSPGEALDVTGNIEASGIINTGVGLDAVGAVDMDYGSADVTDHTFTTDGTGDAEFVVPADSIGSAEIGTIVMSYEYGAGFLNTDGTNCAAPAEVTIGSWGKMYSVICGDNDSSTLTLSHPMPDDWDAGTVVFRLHVIQDAADTSALQGDVAGRCVGDTETPAAYGTEVAVDDTMTGSDALNYVTSAAITLAGTCAAGDFVQIQYQVDATGTTTAMATLNIIGASIEWTSNVGS